tara:strand:- start:331 stop:564 length:234 start_codon:yes stop_codon:yes gene_type:complete
MNNKPPSRLNDIDIFSSDYLAQREPDTDSFDYNLLTKAQKRFVDKQLSEIRRVERKTEEEVLLEKLQSGKIRNLPKG